MQNEKICPKCQSRYPAAERFCHQEGFVLVEQTDMDKLCQTIGNYHIQEVLGRGGMGTVFSGEHVYIGKKVAVKILHPQFAKYDDALKRFLREARAASSINHPNICDVTDFGPMPDGGVYFVMEYLDGTSLEDLIDSQGAMPLHRCLNIANQMALALASAHDEGIIHRDLKPDNIMLVKKPGRRELVKVVTNNDDGTSSTKIVIEKEEEYDYVKILDFGIAKVLTPESSPPSKTLAGAVFGTPEYMSPEAAKGENIDFRSDIYSVGVILFDMICGRPPFEAEASAEVLAMHINTAPPLPSKVAPHCEITPLAEALIMRAMAKDPDKRYQSFDEFRVDLQNCYGSVGYRRSRAVQGTPLPRQQPGLTDEIKTWVKNDPSSLSIEEASALSSSDLKNLNFDSE